MKKLLILGSFIAALLPTACDKNQNDAGPCPVTDIEMPQSSVQNPIKPGSEIVIHGNGFVADCEIWLIPASKEVAAIQAEILQVTNAEVRFLAPLVTGTQTVELRQNGGTWNIGSLTFTDETGPTEILPKRISQIKITYPNELSFVLQIAYDEQGHISSITETDQQYTYPGATPQDEVTNFAYESDRIVITEPSGAQSVLTLDDNRAIAITGVAYKDHYPDDYTFSYDINGYIATSTWSQNPDKTHSAKTIYTVVNGCMTQVQEAEESEEWYGGNASYTNDPERPNNLNIDLFGIRDFITTTDLDRIYLIGAGGNRLKQLPAQINYGEDIVDTYRYTMAGEYISKIEIDENGEPLTILEIFYED